MILSESDPRRKITDFYAVNVLLHSRGWYPEDSTRLHLEADAGDVRAIYFATGGWGIECGDPWNSTGAGVRVTVPSDATYGMIAHMMEHMRTLSGLRSKSVA